MSIRIKLAKWLAPEWEDEFWEMDALLASVSTERAKAVAEEVALTHALQEIRAQRTAKANATVNRMADMANAALRDASLRRRDADMAEAALKGGNQ